MQRVGDLLKMFLSGRLTPEGESMLAVVEAWRELGGEAGAHVRVRDLRHGTVILEADHPGWGQMVSMRKPALLRGLREKVPEMEISDIRVVAAAGSRDSPGSGTRPSPRAEVAGMEPAPGGIDDALSALRDDDLRRALRALYEEAEDR